MVRLFISPSDVLNIEGEMTIYTADELYNDLLQKLRAQHDIRCLDLSKVTEIDTAGLQILLMAQRHAASAGSAFRWTRPSPAVAAMLELLQLPVHEIPAAPPQASR